jgi:hypothetical protein
MCVFENDIKVYLKERGLGDVDWLYLAEARDKWTSYYERDNKLSKFSKIPGNSLLD